MLLIRLHAHGMEKDMCFIFIKFSLQNPRLSSRSHGVHQLWGLLLPLGLHVFQVAVLCGTHIGSRFPNLRVRFSSTSKASLQ